MLSPEFFAPIDSWETFCTRAATVQEGERGTAFEHVVRHYFRFDPKYRTKLADVWFHHEVPADLRVRLNFPPRDEGIDLLARTHAGEFWAVQAKYRSDADATLTHRAYPDEWKGWGDWLGHDRPAPFESNFLPYEEAREFARKKRLKNAVAWRGWVSTHRSEAPDVPVDARKYYLTKGWISWEDFLQPPPPTPAPSL